MTDTATYISPLGSIIIESDGEAITSLRFCREQNSATQGEYAPKATTTPPPIIAETIQWLDDYFAGKRPCNVPRLNPQGTDFQKRVWQALLTIPYAQTKTYGEIAKMVESVLRKRSDKPLGAILFPLSFPATESLPHMAK